MRWRVTWLCVALAMVTGGQHMTIDRDILGPGTGASTPEGVVVAPKPEGQSGSNRSSSSENLSLSNPDPDSVVSKSSEEDGGSTKESGDDSGDCADRPKGDIVDTDRGKVQGFYKHESSYIQSYIDIPYGIFEDAFAAPERPSNWSGIHEEFEHTKRCPQLVEDNEYVGDSDCLTLSVFVPANAINVDVLFHIHDSNFISGSADYSIYGPEYLVTKNVILVLPNYRLGPLGFLCLRNEVAPGNAALKDLTLALSWTKNNIHAFGGNPNNIVVSGDGTAGALVGYLTLSPKSRDYIKGAIIDSGSVLSHWAIDRDPIATAAKLADKLNAESSDSKETLDVFKDLDYEILVKAAENIKFKPCIEGNASNAFLDEAPWKILQQIKINISFMIGSANQAGMHEAVDHTVETIAQLNQNFSLFLPNDLEFEKTEDKSEASERLKKQYFGEASISLNDKEKLSFWHTDASYLGPIIRAARALVESGATVYFYEFSYLGGLNREHEFLGEPVSGAARGDIVGYIFCQGGQSPEVDSNDAAMIELMTTLWVHFMAEGKPPENIEWTELQTTNDSEEYWLSIAAPNAMERQKGLHLDRLRLWTEMYHKHFVDRNWALGLRPSLYSVILSLLLFKLCEYF